jgi:hypothetical protein
MTPNAIHTIRLAKRANQPALNKEMGLATDTSTSFSWSAPTALVEHPELVANRIITFAELVGRENAIAGTDCGLAAASIRKSPGPSCAPCANSVCYFEL